MKGSYAHTCYRVLDPQASIRFYTECLGLEHVREAPIRDEATNHFFAYAGDSEPWLELTHNHDRTEPYEFGTGYGHIAIRVDDLDVTLAALAEKDVQPERDPYLVGTHAHLLRSRSRRLPHRAHRELGAFLRAPCNRSLPPVSSR